jgi:hypothetical protein
VISAREAIEELLEWHANNPDVDVTSFPAFIDSFDYQFEDRLIEAWRVSADEISASVTLEVPPEVHPMPHPTEPGQLVDQKSR